MKYYAIYRIAEAGTSCDAPEMIVESENVAKDFCNKFGDFYYVAEEVWQEDEYRGKQEADEATKLVSVKDYETLKREYDFACEHYNELYAYANKQDKAIKIIKEKGIIVQFIKETYTVEQYNAGVFGTFVKPLTQKEFDLLKEILV